MATTLQGQIKSRKCLNTKHYSIAFDIELKRKYVFQDGVILRLEVCKEEHE
jgi:hypothetical protein